MTDQFRLPGVSVPVRVRKPRPRIADLLREVDQLREALARERIERVRDDALLRVQLADLQQRLAEVERAGGIADLDRAPQRREALRRFAMSRT